jgi:hypothetical protein
MVIDRHFSMVIDTYGLRYSTATEELKQGEPMATGGK